MPEALARSCPVYGCSHHSPCPTHSRRKQWDREHGTAHQRGYTARWRRYAKRFLVEFPTCGATPDGHPVRSLCHDRGWVTLATQVDHKVPHRGDPALFWDRNNLQSLCASCHSAKTQAGQ